MSVWDYILALLLSLALSFASGIDVDPTPVYPEELTFTE